MTGTNLPIPYAELAVSNISWPNTQQAHKVAMEVLFQAGINAIDIAPMLVFPDIVGSDPSLIDRNELVAFRRTLRHSANDADISEMRVAGLQGITFGRTEGIFEDSKQEQSNLVNHVKGIIRLAEFIGAQTIVYGCLGTRLHDKNLPSSDVEAHALEFFTRLDPFARESNVVIGIEPVSATRAPEGMQAFGSTAAEVVDFVDMLHAGYGTTHIKFLPDSFGMSEGLQEVNDVARVVHAAFDKNILSPHAQIAEPNMATPTIMSEIRETHAALDKVLSKVFSQMSSRYIASGSARPTIAIEMFTRNNITMPDLAITIKRAIEAARFHYAATLLNHNHIDETKQY